MNRYPDAPKGPAAEAKPLKGSFSSMPFQKHDTATPLHYDVVNSYSDLAKPERLFYSYFGVFPSIIVMNDVDADKLIPNIERIWGAQITARFTQQIYKGRGRRLKSDETQYVLEQGMVIELTCFNRVKLLHHPGKLEEAQQALSRIFPYLKAPRRDPSKRIHVVVPGNRELDTDSVTLPKVRLDIATHYNDDLPDVHRKILAGLRKKGLSGLYLFHGAPGTGKTTYIRQLIHQMKKKVIFLPPGMLPATEGPEMSKFLIGNANTVFVMEDAEEMLISREQSHNSGMSTLLNLTDGLLGQALGIQFIATFNSDRNRIDKALLRNGRLRMMYEFKPLTAEKSRALLTSLGYSDPIVKGEMTLADIYHYGENNGAPITQRITVGFGR